MAQVVLRTSIDAWASSQRTIGRFGDTRISVHSMARAYQYFTRPQFPEGATITSAKLRLYPTGGTGGVGTVNITLEPLTGPFDPNTLTWVNAPGVGAAIQTLQLPSWMNNESPIEFNVTSKVQEIVNGGAWYGWRITSSEVDPTQSFWSSQADKKPELIIEFSVPPKSPVELFPTGVMRNPKPILRWTTPGGQLSAQMSVQVQVASNISFSSGLYTTNEIATKASMVDLSAVSPAFTAMTNGQTRFWRVRVKNESGLWSGYSAPAQMSYGTPRTLTINTPAASSADPTPNFTWTYSGSQQAFALLVEQHNPIFNSWNGVYDSGVVYSTTAAFELPPGIVVSDQVKYRATLRVWEAGDQISVSGAPLYTEQTKIWDWDPSGATPPIEMQVVDVIPGRPAKYIRWRYTGSTPADNFMIRVTRRGKEELLYTNAAAHREGTSEWYRRYYLPAGRATTKFEISTIIGGGQVPPFTSPFAEGPIVEKKFDHKFPWIFSVYDSTNRFFTLLNPNIDPGLSEISDLVTPVNGAPFLAMYAFNKFNGTASGLISGESLKGSGITSDQMLDDFLWIRENPRVYFLWADQSIEAYIYNTAFVPVPVSNGDTDYAVSFNFVQV